MGVSITDTMRLLEKQDRGSLYLGYELRDVYNKVGEITMNSLEGGDTNALLHILKKRFENEIGFYYDFEIDSDGSLITLAC